MENQKPNKIQLSTGEILMDISDSTVTPETLITGTTAYDASGEKITGTLVQAAHVEEKDVNFYDYDGTLLYSYTVAEAQALTELPPPPTPKKDFLVFDEWNWTLADIKAYNNPLQVGATYKTVDGKTYAIIEITEDWQKNVTLRYKQWCTSIVVDWGDGTAEDPTTTSDGTSVTKTHTYADKGTYIITVNANGTWDMSPNSSNLTFFGSFNNNENVALREVYIGKGARLLSKSFIGSGLEVVVIPKTANRTWADAFEWCKDLKAAILPSTFTHLESGTFRYCCSLRILSLPKVLTTANYGSISDTAIERLTLPPATIISIGGNRNLKTVVIPEGLIELAGGSFSNSYVLREVTLPSTLTMMAASTFYYCRSLMRLRFKSTTPPTVANANAFTNVPTTCIVEVPAGTLATYQAATNYASIAAQMVEVSE